MSERLSNIIISYVSELCIILIAVMLQAICIQAQPTQSQVLELSGKKRWDRFGSSLALQKDIALIRSREWIYCYKHESDSWMLKQIFQGHDSSDDAFKFFGESIDMDNEFAVCGDRKARLDGYKSPGAAYVFKYEDGVWVEYAKLGPDDPQDDRNFAVDVGIDDDLIVVGAHHYDKGGAAYVYRYVDCEWVQEAKLTPSDDLDFIAFGWRVDIDSSRIVIGTFEGESAYIFEHIGGEWVETANIKNTAGRFGSEVVISGDHVFVSARNESPNQSEISTLNALAGAVYQYTKRNDSWKFARRIPPNSVNALLFGSSLAISDTELAIVSRISGLEQGDRGMISFYPIEGTTSKPSYTMDFSIGDTGDRWGGVIEMDGKNIIFSEVDIDSSVVESTGLTHIHHDRVEKILLIDAIQFVDPYCAAEGSIFVTARGGVAPYLYSVDGGISYQESSEFLNLSAGDYNVYVKDGADQINRQCVELRDIAGLEVKLVDVVRPTCDKDIGGLSLVGTGGLGPYNYSIDGIQLQEVGSFENLPVGDYEVYVFDAQGCIDTLEIALTPETIFEIVDAEITHTICGESQGSLLLKHEGATGKVEYAVNDERRGSGAFVDLLAEGTYHIRLTDETNCKAEIELQILSDDCPINIPNIFSPEASGLNGRFEIYTHERFEGTDMELAVYDRWGGQIYHKNNFDPAIDFWDGKAANQQSLPSGVYTVLISYTAANGARRVRRETVTLVR